MSATRNQVRQKFRELSRHTHAMLNQYLEAAFKSGAFDLKTETNTYLLPKNIICAALEDARAQWGPPLHMKSAQKQIKNINRMTYPNYQRREGRKS